MHEAIRQQLKPGAKVRVTQQIAARQRTWMTEVDGTVVRYEQKQTGSWYAHAKDDRLWLDRLTLRKSDGELIKLNLDEYTHIEIAGEGNATAAAVGQAK